MATYASVSIYECVLIFLNKFSTPKEIFRSIFFVPKFFFSKITLLLLEFTCDVSLTKALYHQNKIKMAEVKFTEKAKKDERDFEPRKKFRGAAN